VRTATEIVFIIFTVIPGSIAPSIPARTRKVNMTITGIAATNTEQDLHIHFSSVEGKCVFQAVQWMAPKAVPMKHSMRIELSYSLSW
jgi:hypothetical protein